MVALGWARQRLHPKDLIVLTQGEHHSNLVPWQMLAKETGIELGFVPLTPEGTFDLEVYAALLNRSPKLVALSGMSNVTGYIPPYAQMLAQAQAAGARTLLDAAQLAAHRVLDVAALSVDFLALSSHKLYGPTGIGVLYGTDAALAELKPVFGGGEMVSYVSTDDFSLSPIPYRFEAGTPAIVQAIGFAQALKFVQNIGMASVGDYERELYTYARDQLLAIEGLSVLGYPQGVTADGAERSGIFSMNLEGIHPHDVAQALDARGICVRAGHHCALPLHRALGVPASLRASFGIHTTKADIDALCEALYAAKTLLGSR
jgi:cysteine desulfurase/selenocysteine lyase